MRAALDAGGRVLALGNGGSATDAMDLVADLRAPALRRAAARRALDLTEDAGDPHRDRQRHRDRRDLRAPGHRLRARRATSCVALSTSGNSLSVLEALREARRRGLRTIALRRLRRRPRGGEGLADHVVVSRSEHIPRIQEAQASAYHVLRELVERP